MSGSNCCFLTCIQISQEAGKVAGKNFPQFVVIHAVKGFSIVNEADVFREFFCFLYDPTDVGNLISGSSAFSKSSLNIRKFSVHVLLKAQFSSAAQSCLTLCDPMNCSTPGLPVHHQLSELAQTHVQLSQSGLHQSLLGDSSSHILMRTSGLQRIIS